MGALINTAASIHTATEAHMLLLHHMPHEAVRMRGHGSLLGAMDTTVLVEKSNGVRTAKVIKANDSDEGQSVAFTLESVELAAVGRKVFTAPVVVGAELPAASSARIGARIGARKLNANQQRFVDILTTAIIEAPANVKGFASLPNGITAVDRDMLKRYLVAQGWIEEPITNGARATISNMINALAGKKVIGTTKQHIWVV
jgi:hypothetical protein